jgi:hypothetical protein
MFGRARDDDGRHWEPPRGDRVEASGSFRPDAVSRLVQKHQDARGDHGRALWGLLNYMMWLELYSPRL